MFIKLNILKNWLIKASLKKKAVIVAVVLAVGWFGVTRFLGQGQEQAQYQTAQVEKGTLITSVSASGIVIQGGSASISTQTTGVVKEVYVKDGDIVSAGDKIAEISLDVSSQQRQAAAWASYLSSQNSLKSAQAKMNSLQSDLFKANQAFLNDKGVSNPDDAQKSDPKYIEENADWLQAEADYKNQQGVIDQAQASLTSAWLSYFQLSSTITAPIAGKVSGLTLAQGVLVSGTQTSSSSNNTNSSNNNSSSSQSVGTITSEQNTLQASVSLTEIDVVKAATGQKATITMDVFPDKTFAGKVLTINTNGSVSSGVTTYPATIIFDSPLKNIYPNMAVNVKIITSVKSNVLLVPPGAVQMANGESSVRVMKDGQIKQVTVEVGDSNDTQTEIISGVSEGDTVVIGSMSTTRAQGQNTTSPFGGRGFGGFGGGGAVFRGGVR